jgi:predicted acetyltransferase
MAGVTAVGVLPSHRRRGILRELMRRQLEDIHELGEPLAGLWASESSIYGRFGYGMAARSARLQIDRERTAFIRPYEPGGRMVLEEKEKALEIMPSVYDRVLRGQPGMFGLSPAHWQIRVADLESSREGASPLFFALYESGDGVDGYVTYRLKHDWNADDIPAGTVKVQELMAATTDAYAALWQYCFGIDLRKTIEAPVPAGGGAAPIHAGRAPTAADERGRLAVAPSGRRGGLTRRAAVQLPGAAGVRGP